MVRRATCALALSLLFTTTLFAAVRSSYVAGRFLLELEGKSGGFVKSVAGGFASGNVVEEPDSPDYYFKKHLELPVEYSRISIEVGPVLDPALSQWVRDTLDGKFTRHNGAIVALDYQSKVLRRIDFSNAQITQVVFPRLDARDKTPLSLKVEISPGAAFVTLGGGTYPAGGSGSPKKSTSGSSFRLQIKGLTASQVSLVEELVVDIPLAPPPDAACYICEVKPPRISFPRLEIVVAESSATDWFKWHESFVISGQNGDSDEKSGTLDLLDATLSPLLTLSFSGLGIVTVANEPATSSQELLPRVRASMYVETIALTKP